MCHSGVWGSSEMFGVLTLQRVYLGNIVLLQFMGTCIYM